jgi:hypothetical protein
VIHVEEGLAILLARVSSPFEDDGGPGDDGGGDEEDDDELYDPGGLPDQVEWVQARETSPTTVPATMSTMDLSKVYVHDLESASRSSRNPLLPPTRGA